MAENKEKIFFVTQAEQSFSVIIYDLVSGHGALYHHVRILNILILLF